MAVAPVRLRGDPFGNEGDAMGARPLLVSNDAELIDDVLRLAAANGVDVHLSTDAEGARSRWQLAPLVLIGGDVAASVAGAAMSRRRDVVVISRSPTPEDWQRAVLLGAEHVVSLPEGERWLIDRLADSGEGVSRDARLVAVVGCGGGAGASTFAATLALAAASRSSSTVTVKASCATRSATPSARAATSPACVAASPARAGTA